MSTAKKESPRALSAFEIYTALEKRSLRKVAQKCALSPTTIRGWARTFRWKERAEAIDARIAKSVEEKLISDLVEARVRQLKMVRAGYAKFIEAMQAPGFRMTVAELTGLMKHELVLLGEESDRVATNMSLDDWLRGEGRREEDR